MGKIIVNEKELFTVSCIYCNDQVFNFLRNLLEKNEIIRLICPKCNEETKITFHDTAGVIIGKY